MLNVWIKTAGIILAIVIGYGLKKTGSFPQSAAKTLSRLSINVLLPFVVICNLNGLSISRDLWIALLWGFAVDLVLVAAAVFLCRKKGLETRYIMMYCIPSFNISGFALPVIQSFASEYEVAAVIMFNISITFFFYIVTPVLVQILTAGEKKTELKTVVRGLLHNIPALASFGMLALCLLHITLPEAVITAVKPLANANTAVALLALGLLFEFPEKLPKDNITALLVRLAITGSALLLAWFNVLPFGTIRSAMIIALLAPIPGGSPAMAMNMGYEGSQVAFGVSANLIISVVAMSLMCAILF